jgi:hypothetical protein
MMSTTFSLPINALIEVDGDKVTKVTLLPSQSWSDLSLYDTDERATENARQVVIETVWEPLLELPEDVVWEG